MTHQYGDSHQRLSCTPNGAISKPREGLCVTCKHHDYKPHPFLSGHEVHGAQFLTCKVRAFRSVINGEESDWCHDIRKDNAACDKWENDRACGRCKYAAYSFTRSECRHQKFKKKFTSGEFKGQAYWPEQYGHTYKKNVNGMFGLERVYNKHPHCGKDAPLWKERE